MKNIKRKRKNKLGVWNLNSKAIEVRKKYYREYRKRNKEKFKEYANRYWEKKAEEEKGE